MNATVEIRDSWTVHVPGVETRGTYEDTRETTAEHESALTEIRALARANEATLDERTMSHELNVHHFDMGFTTWYSQLVAAGFGSVGALATFMRAAKPFLLAYLDRSSSHSVTVKYGDTEISVHGSKDLDKVLEAVEKLESLKRK